MAEHKIKRGVRVITFEVEIEGKTGKEKINMALDTGASYVMIPRNFAEILGYESDATTKKIPIITASGVEKAPLIILKSVSVLGKKAENVHAVVHNLPDKSYVDGLLGLSYLINFDICLYFRKEVLEIN